jgi:hypothetical protein
VLANLASESAHEIEAIMSTKHCWIVRKLVHLASESNWETRAEAIHTVCNIFTNGTDEHIRKLIQVGGAEVLLEALSLTHDTDLLLANLAAIDAILERSRSRHGIFGVEQKLLELGFEQKVEDLFNNGNKDVVELAYALADKINGLNAVNENDAAVVDERPPKRKRGDEPQQPQLPFGRKLFTGRTRN